MRPARLFCSTRRINAGCAYLSLLFAAVLCVYFCAWFSFQSWKRRAGSSSCSGWVSNYSLQRTAKGSRWSQTLANQQERVCFASFSLPYSPLAPGRVMKNINLNVRHNNFKEYLKKLIFQVVLLDATEVFMSLQNFSATDEPIALRWLRAKKPPSFLKTALARKWMETMMAFHASSSGANKSN